jgi:hypothetical protein
LLIPPSWAHISPQSYVRGYHGTLGRVFVKYSYRYLNPSLLYMMIWPLQTESLHCPQTGHLYIFLSLAFSQLCSWGLQSSGIWFCLTGLTFYCRNVLWILVEIHWNWSTNIRWTFRPFKMRLMRRLETSGTDHSTTRHHVPERNLCWGS